MSCAAIDGVYDEVWARSQPSEETVLVCNSLADLSPISGWGNLGMLGVVRDNIGRVPRRVRLLTRMHLDTLWWNQR